MHACGMLNSYLKEMALIGASGEASDETSYYPALSNLLNGVGATLAPVIHCVLTPKNRGSGVPDGGFFVKREAVIKAGAKAMVTRAPERGAMEVKGLKPPVKEIAKTKQVARYLSRYGQVLVTNYREFLPVRIGPDGQTVRGEPFVLAGDEDAFWALANAAKVDGALDAAFEEFLRRVLLAEAPLSSPEDLAQFLAAYARTARDRMDIAGRLPALNSLRAALEDALGLRFEGKQGEEFFRSALVQTLFYGVFAAWVVWNETQPANSKQRFSWRAAQWTLNVPMVRVLFEQLATPTNLPAGIDEVLDWTEDVLARVDRRLFFARFESREAVQYFYEPFLKAYDPELRKELGVWYTPREVVRYMVARVHESLQRDLDIPLGLADEQVHVLDPCTGTGSFLVETVRTIAQVLDAHHGDALVAQQAKAAALKRVHGFELLPAPFVVAHLQLGLLLDELGAPLDNDAGERASVYLTNALTGWVAEQHQQLPFNEFEAERDAAETVKRSEPILVVLGNPPYNGFAGVSGDEEGGLLAPYKEGLSKPPWEITANKLDDLYVRFFRVAERRITERTRRGIVCFISNFGWLGDPSTVLMRKRMVTEFDRIYVDNLNGDSRETGKKTPDGDQDPSVFSTTLNPNGITVGTAIAMLVRTAPHENGKLVGLYRDFWRRTKRADLEASLERPQREPGYEPLFPDDKNWYRLRPWNPRKGYDNWPSVTDLAAVHPKLGLNENRDDGLVSILRQPLLDRVKHFLDETLTFDELDPGVVGELLETWARYDAKMVRARLLADSPFSEERVFRFQVKPFDVRCAYVDGAAKLWNESRTEYVQSAELGSEFLLVRRRAPRTLDGAAFLLSPHLIDQHVLNKDAYTIPLLLPVTDDEDAETRLFATREQATTALPWKPNLSERALQYLDELGYDDAQSSRDTARLLWLHVLAVGYAPLYLEENGVAIRNGWPRVPLPPRRDQLEDSAVLGRTISALLDIDTPLAGLDNNPKLYLKAVGSVRRTDGKAIATSDLEVTAGWGVRQVRNYKSGATGHVVMPADGLVVQRARTYEETSRLSERQLQLLGNEVIDIHLSRDVCWSGVPQAAWDFKVGGFQVLRKWLSYREHTILGRPLALDEVRQFTSIVRRLTELTLLADDLDANYRAAVGTTDQDPLPQAA